MSRRREFEIAFVGLKPGIHEFNYLIDDRFFETFQKQDFSKCKANVKLLLDKKSSFMLMKFEIGGTLEVICDRCNSNLPFDLWDEFNITVKMVENPELMNDNEEDPDMYYIAQGESHIDVANWIFEFINLSIPMQKTCNNEEMNGPFCNKNAKDILRKMESHPDKTTGKKNSKEVKENPIWKDLDKFKNLE